MKRMKSYELTEDFKNKIISVAYNDASLIDKIKISRASAKYPHVREIYLSYKRTAEEVKELKENVCPEEILKEIERQTVSFKKEKVSFLYDLVAVLYNRPVLSGLTALILTVAVIAALLFNKPVQYNYSQAEVFKAEQEARYALSIVNNVLNQTNNTLKNEVLNEKVSKPIRESIGFVNNLFKGEKNEIN